MNKISEITITAADGTIYVFHISKYIDHYKFEVTLIEPEPLDIAQADSFDQAMDEITTYLFNNEIDL